MDITGFQLKRVNPFQGLIIDDATWQDAHNYHRDQQRLHVLAFHDFGVVSGLEITALNPPESSVNIGPGMAIDPDGNVILVPKKQLYRIETPHEKGIIFLIIQFREVPEGPYQPPDGGQATRILEAYRIQEREHLPSESYIELARIDFDPSQPKFRDAKNSGKPSANEIDLRYRKSARPSPVAASGPIAASATVTPSPASARTKASIGHAVLGEADKELHASGMRSLIRDFERESDYAITLEGQVDLRKDLARYKLLYLTGNGRFELSAAEQSCLNNYLQGGGIIFGDGCSCSAGVTESKLAREFGLAFNRCAGQLDRKLELVKRGHALLTTEYVFSEPPQGAEPAMLLEGGNMICSNSDYGCAWEGGHDDRPLPRDVIRSAFEMGKNVLAYALRTEARTK